MNDVALFAPELAIARRDICRRVARSHGWAVSRQITGNHAWATMGRLDWPSLIRVATGTAPGLARRTDAWWPILAAVDRPYSKY